MLVFPDSTQSFARREAGGKGYNLYQASRLGFPVPRWAILGRSVYSLFVEEAKLGSALEAMVQEFFNGQVSAGETARAIEQLFMNAPATPDLYNSVKRAYEFIGEKNKIAVRSSSIDEDSLGHSFAGQLSSYLYVDGVNDALRYVSNCFASAFSERCLSYRVENNLNQSQIEVAVILQEMIDPDVSGVLFTCNPVTEEADEFLISSVYGVGEGLVSGALDADNFWIALDSGTVLRSDVATKKNALKGSGSGTIEVVGLSEEKSESPSLDGAQIELLYRLGKKILAAFGRPQDIEWAIKDGTLYLLQTRPVTSLKNDLTGFPNLWDNSNIVESYGGITSPLSFTFALNNYRLVYHQFCEVLGVSHRIVREMDHYLRNMLGCIDGRVYYNLYNWYKLIGVLPGFKSNREFMETMMGVREQLTEEISERISPHPSWNTTLGKFRKFRVGIRFIYYHYCIQRIVDNFQQSFRVSYSKFRSIDYSSFPGDRIFQHYLEMEREMIGDWKAPIINDFLCMVHFGLLRKLTSRWLSDVGPHIHNDLLAGDGNLESAEPTRELLRLALLARATPELQSLIQKTATKDLLEVLNQSSYQEFYKEIQTYIDRFGFRCMNEMKLEEIDLFSDPTYLFTCLKNYLNNSDIAGFSLEKHEKDIRDAAEHAVHSHLTGIKRAIFKWVLFHTRKAVRNRENTRFARTRAYGVARSMFQAMGTDLAANGILERAEDVFYLTLEEVYGIYQGTLSAYCLKDFVQLRRNQYREFESTEPAIRFLTRGAVYWNNCFEAEAFTIDTSADGEFHLKGLPCCPGVVEGVVKIVTCATEDLTLNGEILVTPRTDPGWVPLYPSVSALLVERGSLLSHSAIVAREMGLPAIVGIEGLLQVLQTGMRVRMDGGKGTITILQQ